MSSSQIQTRSQTALYRHAVDILNAYTAKQEEVVAPKKYKFLLRKTATLVEKKLYTATVVVEEVKPKKKKLNVVKTIEQGRVETAKERNLRVGHKVDGGVVYRWGLAHDASALKYCRGGCCGLINKDFCHNCEHGEGMDKEWDGDWRDTDGYCQGCDWNPTTNHYRDSDSE